MTLCVIFGARPSYRQITSSSVSLAWMCSREAAHDDAIFRDCSIIQVKWENGKTPCKTYWGQEKERCVKRQSWQTAGVMNGKTARWKLALSVDDLGFSTCTCTLIPIHTLGSWQPMCEVKTAESHEILSSKMIYSPCQKQWKQNWVSMMKCIIAAHLMNQKTAWRNIWEYLQVINYALM